MNLWHGIHTERLESMSSTADIPVGPVFAQEVKAVSWPCSSLGSFLMEEEVTHAEDPSSLLSWSCSHRHVSWVRLNLLKLTRHHILQLNPFHHMEEWLYIIAPFHLCKYWIHTQCKYLNKSEDQYPLRAVFSSLFYALVYSVEAKIIIRLPVLCLVWLKMSVKIDLCGSREKILSQDKNSQRTSK